MSVLRDTCDEIGCRRLWAHVLAMQWDVSFGSVAATKLHRWETLQWFGSKDFYMVCALANLDGRAVLSRWRDQQDRMAGGERGFAPATPTARPNKVGNLGSAA